VPKLPTKGLLRCKGEAGASAHDTERAAPAVVAAAGDAAAPEKAATGAPSSSLNKSSLS
jgi:hypothetical protein